MRLKIRAVCIQTSLVSIINAMKKYLLIAKLALTNRNKPQLKGITKKERIINDSIKRLGDNGKTNLYWLICSSVGIDTLAFIK